MADREGVVLVTGGSRGIGRAIVQRFVDLGYDVDAPSRERLDLSSVQSVAAFIKEYDQEVSVLVNNAGINILGGLECYKQDDLNAMLQTNFLSALELSTLGIRSNKLRYICNIASIWSVKSFAGRAVYSATKSALVGLTRGLANDLGSRGVLVNSVSPGFIETEMTAKNITAERRSELYQQIPLGRFGTPEAVARLVSFLCSANNDYITGQNLVIDGGFLS